MRNHSLEGAKFLRVYDDLFPLSFRMRAHQFAFESSFRIGWGDGPINDGGDHKYLHSTFSAEDVERLGILHEIRRSSAAHELEGYRLEKTVLNLSVPTDPHYVHTHPEDKILLYYVNSVWQDGWHGETMFYDEACKEIVYASPYTPGRLIAFDASIPHAIRPQSKIAPAHRFTLALIFVKER